MKLKELFKTKENWLQGHFWGGSNSFCLVGGVFHCYPPAQTEEIKDKIRKEIGVYYLTEWNDDPARTFSDIKNLVEKLDI